MSRPNPRRKTRVNLILQQALYDELARRGESVSDTIRGVLASHVGNPDLADIYKRPTDPKVMSRLGKRGSASRWGKTENKSG